MSRPDGYLLRRSMDPMLIVAEVARGFMLEVEDLTGESRQSHIVVARACAMAVVREHTNLSYPSIGRLFGRDHTTVMHHVRKVMSDPTLCESVRQVFEELAPPPTLFAVEDAS